MGKGILETCFLGSQSQNLNRKLKLKAKAETKAYYMSIFMRELLGHAFE